VDDALDAYVDWREEFAWVRTSDDRWTRSNGAEAGNAFMAYRAAVERKRAAHVYAECIVRVVQRARQWS
jgi:hypothetical protein